MTRFLKDESGQGMIEYVLIIAVVALAAVAILFAVRAFMNRKGDDINNQLTTI